MTSEYAGNAGEPSRGRILENSPLPRPDCSCDSLLPTKGHKGHTDASSQTHWHEPPPLTTKSQLPVRGLESRAARAAVRKPNAPTRYRCSASILGLRSAARRREAQLLAGSEIHTANPFLFEVEWLRISKWLQITSAALDRCSRRPEMARASSQTMLRRQALSHAPESSRAMRLS